MPQLIHYEGRRVVVEILTDTHMIRGTVFVPLAGKAGFNSRLSDCLNNSEKRFLALTDVKAEGLRKGVTKWEAPFLAVNKSAVTMIRAIKD